MWNVNPDEPESEYERDEEDDWGTAPQDEVYRKAKVKPITTMRVEHDLVSRSETSTAQAAAYTSAQMQYDKYGRVFSKEGMLGSVCQFRCRPKSSKTTSRLRRQGS